MPSADETRTTYLIEVMPDTAQDFLARDVDLLVSQIKENLRLSGLKAKSSMSHKNRTYPYQLPSRSWSNSENCELCSRNNANSYTNHHHYHHHHHHHHYNHKHSKRPPAATAREEDDSYLYFRELLREGSLIKEAVKRLHQNFDELESSEVEEVDVDEDEDEDPQRSSSSSTTSSFYRRKPYFYDSEDEPLPSSVYEPLEL